MDDFLVGLIQTKVANVVKRFLFSKKIYAQFNSVIEFNQEFEGSELDNKTFDDYIKSQPVISYLEMYFFESLDNPNDFEKIVTGGVKSINEFRKSHNLSSFTNRDLVEKYFSKLKTKLKDVRSGNETLEEILKHAEYRNDIQNEFVKREGKITLEKLQKLNAVTIDQLGDRYSPEINIKNNEVSPFDALFQTDTFISEWEVLVNDLFTNYHRLRDYYSQLKDIQLSEWNQQDAVSESESIVQDIEKQLDLIGVKIKRKTDEKEKNLEVITKKSLYKIKAFQQQTLAILFEQPYMVVVGPAGIGKSHLLADLVGNEHHERPMLFTLGEQFSPNSLPLEQIIKLYGESFPAINTFLNEYSSYAAALDKRAFIIIDALNETNAKNFWKYNLEGFVHAIKQFSNIGIIFSLRNTYYQDVVPKDFFEKNGFQIYSHPGLTKLEDSDLNQLEEYYGVATGELKRIYPDLNNPLFLKMAALSVKSGNRALEWEEILKGYLIGIEKEISTKFNYEDKILIEVLEKFAMAMHQMEYPRLSTKDARKLIAEVLNEYYLDNISANDLLNSLKLNGLIRYINDLEDVQRVDFTFEKVKDFLVAKKLSDNIGNADSAKEIFSDLLDKHAYGVLETLLFIIPNQNKYDFEVVDLFSDIEFQDSSVRNAIISSLMWRSIGMSTDTANDRVKAILEKDRHENITRFFRNHFLSATNQFKPFNAQWLTNQLKNLSNDRRDSIFSVNVSIDLAREITKLVQIIGVEEVDYSMPQVELAAKELIWLLSVVNLEVRDEATLALTRILLDHPDLINNLLIEFASIDDRYVVERLYAAVFGAIVHVEKFDLLPIAKTVYEQIFDHEEVIPHILIRDYAKQIIEFIVQKNGSIDGIDVSRIRPPYNSQWYGYEVETEQVDEFVESVGKAGETYWRALNIIKSSMTTEYGRGIGQYGDFGRYVFESRLTQWKNQFDIQKLSNLAIDRMFALGYNLEYHADFDANIGYRWGDRMQNSIERIGKKYQRIALQEMHAILADNFQVYKEEPIYDESYQAQIPEIIDRALAYIENGEINEAFNWFDKNKLNNSSDGVIEYRKENEHYYELTFDDFVREIDPTTLELFGMENVINETKNIDVFDSNSYAELLYTHYQGKRYVALDRDYINKKKTHQATRRILSYAVAMLVDVNELDAAKNEQHFGVLEAPQLMGMYLHELYWGNVYSLFEKQFEDEEVEEHMHHASNVYFWEYDKSTGVQTLRVRVPAKKLVDYFDLHLTKYSKWLDADGELVAFDGVFINQTNALWFDSAKLEQYLDANNQRILWKGFVDDTERDAHVTIIEDEKWEIINHED